ncbi:MAG TPA: energy-coupling factor transporter ATPase [Paenibacillus sp.]
MSTTAIELQGLTYTFDEQSDPVLNHITLSIPKGQWVAVLGRGGSGKSTLCQLLNGYLPRSGGGHRSGAVRVEGMDPAVASLADIAHVIGIVFQDADAQLVQGNVEADVAFGPENLRVPPADIAHRVTAALAAVGLTPHRDAAVRELSGGQRQRAAIAAVLALAPRLLVFDDATASLDGAAQVQFVQLCEALHEQGRTLLCASGRFDDVARAAERVIVLEGGAVVLDGTPQELLTSCTEQLVQLGLLPTTEWAEHPSTPSPTPALSAGVVPKGVDLEGVAASSSSIPALGDEPKGAELEGIPTAPLLVPVLPVVEQRPFSSRFTTGSDEKISLLAVKSLSYAYPRGTEALHKVSFTLQPGDWVTLMGENGSGKTTLSRLLMGLLRAPGQMVYWRGQDIANIPIYTLAEEIGYVFQQPEHQFVAHTVWEEITYGCVSMGRRKRRQLTPQQRDTAEQMLLEAGLLHRREDSPYLLSQGEKRLLSVVSQFMMPKRMYILDEPTSGIDYIAAQRILKLCRQQVLKGNALLMITHDPDLVQREATFSLKLHQGRLV